MAGATTTKTNKLITSIDNIQMLFYYAILIHFHLRTTAADIFQIRTIQTHKPNKLQIGRESVVIQRAYCMA